MEGFYYGYTAERHTVVVNKEHYISVGLLQHGIHPAAVIQFLVMLCQWQLEMAEDAFLLVRQTGIGSWPVEGMDLRVQGSGLLDAPCSPIARDRSPSGDAC